MSLPLLEGVRILELALLMPADHVGSILADLGADVIKVEQPPYGDYVRELGGTLGPGISEFHLFYNRNKRSLALNLRSEEGQKIFHQLVAESDVVYESGTPGTREKLRADYESCRAINPNIIYASFPGYGYKSPYNNMPAHGWGVYAFTNSSPIERMEDGRLRRGETPEGGFTDPGPFIAALSIVSAVIRKLRTGEGARLDMAMSDPLIYAQHSEAFKLLNDYPVFVPHSAPPGRSNSIRFNYYECGDGGIIAFQAVEKKFWDNFCRVVKRDDWISTGDWPITIDFGTDEPEIEQEMIKIFKTKPLKEWMRILSEADIPVSPGYTLDQVLQDPHVAERGLISEYDHPGFGPIKQIGFPLLMDGAKFRTSRYAPFAGQHNEEILKSLSYSDAEILTFKENKIIGEDTRLQSK